MAGRPVNRLPGVRRLLSLFLFPSPPQTVAPAVRPSQELRLPSLRGRPGPLSSPVPALRVGSSRGPTSRSACRSATSAWTRRATGLVCSDRSDHPDRRTPEPSVRRRPPRKFPSELTTQGVVETARPYPSPAWREANIPLVPGRTSAAFSLGYASIGNLECGKVSPSPHAGSALFPRRVDLWRTGFPASPQGSDRGFAIAMGPSFLATPACL